METVVAFNFVSELEKKKLRIEDYEVVEDINQGPAPITRYEPFKMPKGIAGKSSM